jgi:putative ABC transport system permease protein
LGVAVILAISITNLSTLESINTIFDEASGKADLVVISSETSSNGFAESVVRQVATVPDVEAAIPSIHAQTLLADEVAPTQVEVNFFGAVGGGLQVYGIDPLLDQQAREYKIVAGEFLSSDLDVYEIVLVEEYAADKDIQVGSDVDILTPQGVETLRVVGLISREGPGQLNNGAFGAVPLRAAQEVFGRVGDLDQIDIVAASRAASASGLDILKEAVQAQLGDEYRVIYPATQGRRVTQMLDVYQMGLQFFSVIALFVGAFLIYNAFSMTVVERTREIGMLRTVGMTKRQVMRQILAEAGILGILGSALGVGAGVMLSRGLIRLTELLLAQEVKQVHVPTDGLVTSVLVGVLVTLVAACIPAWQAGRISPLEALRIRGSTRDGWFVRRGWLLGVVLLLVSYLLLYRSPLPPRIAYQMGSGAVFTLFLGATLVIPATVGIWEWLARPGVSRIYGNEGRLGSRNVQRAKMRTALTVAALMVSVAMILGVRAMTEAFEHDIQAWIDVYVGGDLYVYSSVPMRTDLGRRLEAVDGVAAVTPIRYFDVNRSRSGDDERLAFTAIDPSSYGRVTSFVFAPNQGVPDVLLSQLAAGDAVFVSSALSELHGLEQGDTIRLETRRGERDFQIAAIVVDFYNHGNVIEGSRRDMRRYFRLQDVSTFLLKVEPGYSPEQVQERIDRIYGERHHLTIESNQAIKSRALDLTAQAFSLFDVLGLISMIVAALGVVNTLTMNVLERTQEIGMLRGIGMTRRQVRKMILAEAGMMGLIGGVFGLAFGLFLSRVFLMATAVIQGYQLTYVLPTEGILVGLLIALVVSQLAAVWPARRAAGITIVEAIQCE